MQIGLDLYHILAKVLGFLQNLNPVVGRNFITCDDSAYNNKNQQIFTSKDMLSSTVESKWMSISTKQAPNLVMKAAELSLSSTAVADNSPSIKLERVEIHPNVNPTASSIYRSKCLFKGSVAGMKAVSAIAIWLQPTKIQECIQPAIRLVRSFEWTTSAKITSKHNFFCSNP